MLDFNDCCVFLARVRRDDRHPNEIFAGIEYLMNLQNANTHTNTGLYTHLHTRVYSTM